MNEGAICGDGMCPYIPCETFPDCIHFKDFLYDNKILSNEVKE